MKGIIFLDIDGVLNCQLHYQSEQFKKYVANSKSDKVDWDKYYLSQLSIERVQWLNELCEEMDLSIVISSTWRIGKAIEELQRILNLAGATFEIIGKTEIDRNQFRGNEIYKWIELHSVKLFNQKPHIFRKYVILDDDSDMLYWQKNNLFIVDSYAGLTPNICYQIKNFFKGFE